MIYLLIFLFLFFTAYLYDIVGERKYKCFLFNLSLIVLILVSGLRYRLGADTIVYMYYFNQYPDLANLTWEKIINQDQEPLWVLLNSMCKSITTNFFLLQLVVSSFHILVWGYFVKNYCPSCQFLMLLFFYMFEFTHLDMVLMREALSISMFILMIIALNKKKYFKVFIYMCFGFFLHKFSIFVFAIVLFSYYFVSKYYFIYLTVAFAICIFISLYPTWIQEQLGQFILSTDSIYNGNIKRYLNREMYSESSLNWKGYLGTYLVALLYSFILWKNKKVNNGILLKKQLFNSIIVIAILLLIIKSSYPIVYRFYDYFQTFSSLLVVSFFVTLTKTSFVKLNKSICYLCFMLIPLYYCYKIYSGPWVGNPSDSVHEYMEFYPYSSVLDPSLDPKREQSINRYAFD